jgi:hypothetical protein
MAAGKGKGKKPARPPGDDPVAETVLDLRDRIEANAGEDILLTRARDYVMLAYAFRVLAKRRRRLGLAAVQELAPWLATFVRRRTVQGGPAMLLSDCFWDFTSDEAHAWLAAQPALAHLVPPPIEEVLVHGKWNIKQRVFSRLRERDPAAARALLEDPPAELQPADRRNLIGLLRLGVSEDDRAFLEREQSPLLVYLPGSSLWNELGQLADKLMIVADGKLQLTPPDRFEGAFERLGLSEKKAADASWATFTVPQYWLYQFLRALPLDSLAARWHLEPGAVLDLFFADADHARYRWAIYGNIFRLGSAVWSRALLERRARFAEDGPPATQCRALARHLPPREREAALEPFIDAATIYEMGDEFADAFDHVWTPAFTRRMLAWALRSRPGQPPSPDIFDTSSVFTLLVHHGNAEVIDELPALVPSDLPEARGFRDDLAAAWRERDEILSRF